MNKVEVTGFLALASVTYSGVMLSVNNGSMDKTPQKRGTKK